MTAVLAESVARALCDDWAEQAEASSPSAARRPAGTDTPLRELSHWAATLRPQAVPCRVLKLAASQVLSQIASIRAGLQHPLGRKLVAAFGHPMQRDPRQAAGVFAALGSWLNLDDTAYAGHLSNSTVAVPSPSPTPAAWTASPCSPRWSWPTSARPASPPPRPSDRCAARAPCTPIWPARSPGGCTPTGPPRACTRTPSDWPSPCPTGR
nr:MmgE/PrpD family protein [Streptomyces sp. DconLS]